MKINILKIAFLIGGSFLLAACKDNASQATHREAKELYDQTYKLLTNYIDSISHASDSTSVSRISANFENKIAKLNFKFKADADLEMTEQENDTIYSLMKRYVSIRDSRLEKLHLAATAVEGDTETDSITMGKKEGLRK